MTISAVSFSCSCTAVVAPAPDNRLVADPLLADGTGGATSLTSCTDWLVVISDLRDSCRIARCSRPMPFASVISFSFVGTCHSCVVRNGLKSQQLVTGCVGFGAALFRSRFWHFTIKIVKIPPKFSILLGLLYICESTLNTCVKVVALHGGVHCKVIQAQQAPDTGNRHHNDYCCNHPRRHWWLRQMVRVSLSHGSRLAGRQSKVGSSNTCLTNADPYSHGVSP